MSIEKLNKKKVKFNFQSREDFEYHTLEEVYMFSQESIIPVKAVYLNDSKYGKQGLLVTEGYFINLPKHLTPDIQEILLEDSLIDDINNGKVGIQIYEYDNKLYNKKGYSINWKSI